MLSKLLIVNLFVLAFVTPDSEHGHHWRETAYETIWTGRFGNCDHGYYVILPSGVLGHDTLPPAPNHGFYVNLAAPASDDDASKREHRIIWVSNDYVMEPGDDAYTVGTHSHAHTVRNSDGTEQHFNAPRQTHLATLKAILVTGSYRKDGVTYRTESIAAPSRDQTIEYQISFDTPQNDFLKDEQTFREILAGFHTSKIDDSGKECSND